jgi:hypothetical protein
VLQWAVLQALATLRSFLKKPRLGNSARQLALLVLPWVRCWVHCRVHLLGRSVLKSELSWLRSVCNLHNHQDRHRTCPAQ